MANKEKKEKKVYCDECNRYVLEAEYDFVSGMCKKCDSSSIAVDDEDGEEED